MIESWSLKYLLEMCPPSVMATVAIAVLVSWLTLRLNKFISGGIDQQDRVRALEKQQRKAEQLLESCPCITKCNATWLQDKGRNGGQPPERVACQYLAAKERGEK